MESYDIKKKSISGAKSTILLTLLSVPLTYGTNIILGRIGPEALGTYGLVLVFIAIINAFILFGGNTIIIKILPEIGDDKKIPFLRTYVAIALIISIIFIILSALFPRFFKLITQMDLTLTIFNFAILFIPVVVIQQFILYSLNGMMEVGVSVFLEKIIPILNFIVILFLFLLFKDFITKNYQILIWLIYTGLFLISAIAGFYFLRKKLKERHYASKMRFFVPKNFWTFSLFVQASALLFFLYDKLDNLFMVNYFSVSELGYYVAALQTAMLVILIPMLLGRVMLPTFSNLLAANDMYLLTRGYQVFVKYNVIISVPIALFLIFFSKQVMGIFGTSYAPRDAPLIILSSCFALTVISQINSSLVILKNRTGLYLLNSIIQISIQLALILLLIKKYEAIGISVARAVGLLFAQTGLCLIVFKNLNLKLQFPKSYIASIITILTALLICFLFPDRNPLTSYLFFILTFLMLILIGNYGIEDILFLKKHLFSKNKV